MATIKVKDIFNYVKANTKESIADSFVSELNYSIVQYNKNNSSNIVSQSYKPSSMNCIRNMYYQITGTEIDEGTDNTTADMIGIGESGTDRHCRIQDAVCHMKDCGIDCEYVDVETYIKEHNIPNLEIVTKRGYETKLINTKYNFRFMCDGIIKYKGQYYILEIKTEVSFKWNNRDNVDPSHYKQATAYALNFGINNVLFVYENRDTCAKKGYIYEVKDYQIKELTDLIYRCDNFVSLNELPPIPMNLNSGSKECRYCSYRNRCMTE